MADVKQLESRLSSLENKCAKAFGKGKDTASGEALEDRLLLLMSQISTACQNLSSYSDLIKHEKELNGFMGYGVDGSVTAQYVPSEMKEELLLSDCEMISSYSEKLSTLEGLEKFIDSESVKDLVSKKGDIKELQCTSNQRKVVMDELWKEVIDFLSAYNTILNSFSEKFVILDKITSLCEEQVGIK
eukprot:Nk52_evm1s295 gene=Nk52_evmTU1s295